jgi:Uma2 family endonuclease
MNAIFPTPGLADRRFTVADIQALVVKGVIREDAKFELVGGDIVPMSPKGPLHEDVRLAVMRWIRGLPSSIEAIAETTLWLDEHNFLEPDYVLFDRTVAIADLKAADVILAIEVADTSWRYDTETKAALYAKHGVQEYWAIHAPTRMVRVHRGPGANGWAEVREVAAGEAIAPKNLVGTRLSL